MSDSDDTILAIRADVTRSLDEKREKRAKRQAASINNFIRTAQRGRSGAASSGERTARRLAAALNDIGDDIALLDSATLEGLQALILAAAGPWPTDEAKHQIWSAIAKAGKRS